MVRIAACCGQSAPEGDLNGLFLEWQGLLARDAENSYLSGDAVEAGPMDQLLVHSITYRIAVGPQAGR